MISLLDFLVVKLVFVEEEVSIEAEEMSERFLELTKDFVKSLIEQTKGVAERSIGR